MCLSVLMSNARWRLYSDSSLPDQETRQGKANNGKARQGKAKQGNHASAEARVSVMDLQLETQAGTSAYIPLSRRVGPTILHPRHALEAYIARMHCPFPHQYNVKHVAPNILVVKNFLCTQCFRLDRILGELVQRFATKWLQPRCKAHADTLGRGILRQRLLFLPLTFSRRS